MNSKQIAANLDAKRQAWQTLWNSKPERDFTDAEVDSLQQMNAEMADLGKKYDTATQLEATADANRKALDDSRTPVTRLETPRAPREVSEVEAKTLGEVFTQSASFKSFNRKSGVPAVAETEYKTLLTIGSGYVSQNIRQPGVIQSAQRLEHVADLIPQGRTNGNAILFMTETTFTNAAATVAEGGTKPEAALAFTETSVPVRKIAVNIPVTDELLEDVPAIESYINGRLIEMLKLTEDVQLVSGSGTSPNMTGFLNVSGLQTQAKGTDPVPDAIYKAMTKVRVTGRANVTGIIMHPNDWQDIRLLRTSDGMYIWGNPSDPGVERIWGVDVVVTDAMTENTALVGDFRTHSQLFRRNEISVQASSEHSTLFVENKVLIQVEERAALVVYRGSAFAQVTGI